MIAVSEDIDVTQRSPLLRHKEAQRLRLAVLDRKREVLLRLRREGTIDDLVARKILAGLDLEEIRTAVSRRRASSRAEGKRPFG